MLPGNGKRSFQLKSLKHACVSANNDYLYSMDYDIYIHCDDGTVTIPCSSAEHASAVMAALHDAGMLKHVQLPDGFGVPDTEMAQ
jgi:hypothetical protein